MTSISTDKGMDRVMHIFQTIVLTATVITVRSVRERRIVWLRSNELISLRVKPMMFSQQILKFGYPTYDAPLATNCWFDNSGWLSPLASGDLTVRLKVDSYVYVC